MPLEKAPPDNSPNSKVIAFPRCIKAIKGVRASRFDTDFIRGTDTSPAIDELQKLRGRRLVGEPEAGWRATI